MASLFDDSPRFNDSLRNTGASFEHRIAFALECARRIHPTKIFITKQESLTLQNNEVVRPDFHLRVDFNHERSHYLIECQKRKQHSKDLLHKIQHIRNKHNLKTFIFVHAGIFISDELTRALDAEGVMHMSHPKFLTFLKHICLLLGAQAVMEAETAPGSGGNGFGSWDNCSETEVIQFAKEKPDRYCPHLIALFSNQIKSSTNQRLA